jgi:endonuclease YncB( thermonuclease family)
MHGSLLVRVAGLTMIGIAEAAAAAPPAAAPAPPAGCEDPVLPDRITGIADGVIALASGQRLRLADIRFAEPDRMPAGMAAWLAGLGGAAVRVATSAADRWDVRRGRLAVGEGSVGAVDLTELLVAEGLALVDAGEQDRLCRPDLLSLEAKARAAGLGLWSAPNPSIFAAADTAALAGRLGQFTIVEGRVFSVGERPARAYLNFGRFGSGGFTLTLPKRAWAELRRRGLSAEGLRGRRVRMRGAIEMWRAPVMEIVAPDMLEMLPVAPEELR